MNNTKSSEIFKKAESVMPGGVNSPVRAFKSVGIDPIFVDHAKGSRLYDVDGNEYLDLICSWGPLILGHANDYLMDGLMDVFKKGTSYGVPTEIEVTMAELICDAYPAVELVRMVNSGTEATMSALRVARGYTKRDKIVKFEGCYHGHSDALLVKSGSGTLTYGVPTSPGVPADTVKDTLVSKYNDIEALRALFAEHGKDVACIIVEAVAGNMGVVPATKEFLVELRRICDEYGSILIFDEVITGFRIAYGGAAEVYGVKPDMACFGKIIGGGLPVGAYGGKKEIMSVVSPLGAVYQAGTLSGNPLAMHMGSKSLEMLRDNPEIYTTLEEKGIYIENKYNEIIKKNNYPLTVTRKKGMVCLFFGALGEVLSYDDVAKSDTQKYSEFFRNMLELGVLMPPAQFEGYFLSTAHTYEDLDELIEKTETVLAKMYK